MRLLAALGISEDMVMWAVLAFATGMFLPGPFGAYLMERCSRKRVALWSVFAMGFLALPVKYLQGWPACLVILYGLQGACFGLAQTALGSTLVNDVLLSKDRDRGDILYAWAGRLGIPLGLLAGMWMPAFSDVSQFSLFVLVPCVLAFLLIGQTSVPLKAPVPVPIASLDRFLLPRSLYLSLSLFAAPFVFGYMVARGGAVDALLFVIGFAAVYALQIFVCLPMGQRASISLGYSFIILGLAVISSHAPYLFHGLSLFLIGSGVSVVSSRHLLQWIKLAEHCQRGTAQSTYMLSWRVAFSVGFACACISPALHFLSLIALCLVSLSLYIARQYVI